MDGSELVFIVMPIVIPLVLGIMVALPFVADRVGRAHRERGREPERAEIRFHQDQPAGTRGRMTAAAMPRS